MVKNNITEQYVILDFINYDINTKEFIDPTENIKIKKNKWAIINGSKTKLKHNFNIKPDELNEYTYIIDYNKFKKHLVKKIPKKCDINNDNPLIKQLKLDIPRSKIYTNGRLVKKTENFIDYLLCKYNKELEKFVFIANLCTQAIFSLPILLIQQNIDSKFFIAELSYQEYTQNKLEKTHVIKLELKENYKCSAYKWLRVVKMDESNNPVTVFIFCLIIKVNSLDDYVIVDIALLN